MQKLAIEADKEEDHYDTFTTIKSLKFPGVEIDRTIGNLPAVIDGVLTATSYARKEEIQAWEVEIVPCDHIKSVQQDENKEKPDIGSLDQCASCDLKENLWLCLTCANVGCGRAQFGGVGGNSHGLDHFENTGHVSSVKLGSITPEGNADVFCYACSEEVQDPQLVTHLQYWGINIADRVQTEKSVTEMNIEQNLKWDFSMTTEDGKELTPLFGPGITGMRNLGNSCYMASVLQCLFSLPKVQERYYSGEFKPTTTDPANDLEVQMRKLADGLLSGRYSIPADDTEGDQQHQKGIAPGMFKALIGRGHAEFSTMRQQDAFEFLCHLLDKLSYSSRQQGKFDVLSEFQFDTEQRIQCDKCKQVKYKTEHQENISVPVPARKINDTEYDSIKLKECLDQFTANDPIDFKCLCGNTTASSKTMFKSFPNILALNARRFQIVNWVPTKLDIPVEVSNEPFDLDCYLSSGKQDDEKEMVEPEEEDDTFVPNQTALEQLEQMGMPKVRAEKALHATGNSDVETAMNWLLENMEDPDIDVPIKLRKKEGEKEKRSSSSNEPDAESVAMLVSMGIPEKRAKAALLANNGNPEMAITWVFDNPEEAEAAENAPEPPAPVADGPRGDSSLPARYQLKGIICHKGASIHAGHYVAFVRKQTEDGEKWVLFNDEKCVEGAEAEEMKKFAYVYLFERVRA